MYTAVGDLPTGAVRALQAELLPCLIFEDGLRDGTLIPVEDRAISLGRSATNEVMLEGETISRKHCAVTGKGTSMMIADLGSTNGTFVNERQVTGAQSLQLGDLVRVGDHKLRFMLRSRTEVRAAEAIEADLERAARYVMSLLPQRIERGPVVIDWEHVPCMTLGGDVFGYRKHERGMIMYLLEVSGSGVGAAMHATAIQAVLSQSSIVGVDPACPTQVLNFLNERFQMDHHEGLCFTIWYGFYDIPSRRLTYSTGGKHPALMVSPDRKHIVPLQTKNPMLGALPTQKYPSQTIDMPPSWSLYLFSDGAFQINDAQGRLWTVADFEKLIRVKGPVEPGEPGRILRDLRHAMAGVFEDDVSILTATFV